MTSLVPKGSKKTGWREFSATFDRDELQAEYHSLEDLKNRLIHSLALRVKRYGIKVGDELPADVIEGRALIIEVDDKMYLMELDYPWVAE